MAEVTRERAYEEQIKQLNREHQEGLRKLRFQARHDDGLSPMERAVLGTTGSHNILGRWVVLDQAVRAHIGEPVLTIKRQEGDTVTEARAGFITGEPVPNLNFRESDSSVMDTWAHASLVVPIHQGVELHSQNIWAGLKPGMRTISQNEITLSELYMTETKLHSYAEDDVSDRGYPPLIGYDAIRADERFDRGISNLMFFLMEQTCTFAPVTA